MLCRLVTLCVLTSISVSSLTTGSPYGAIIALLLVINKVFSSGDKLTPVGLFPVENRLRSSPDLRSIREMVDEYELTTYKNCPSALSECPARPLPVFSVSTTFAAVTSTTYTLSEH